MIEIEPCRPFNQGTKPQPGIPPSIPTPSLPPTPSPSHAPAEPPACIGKMVIERQTASVLKNGFQDRLVLVARAIDSHRFLR
ncbi:MAG: hypothetical protein ACKN9U_23130 [Pirellulaceae bacterium]